MLRFLLVSVILIASLVVIDARRGTCREKCGVNEVCNTCGSHCEVECSERPFKACSRVCNLPACACKRGFYRDDNTKRCVPANECSVPPQNSRRGNNWP